MRGRALHGAWAVAVTLLGCGGDATSLEAASGTPREAAPGASDDKAGGAAPGEPAREREVESDYEAPVATGRLVWIANPKSGRVALVDATTLEVRTVEAGNGPTYLAGVPNQAEDTTVVLNVLSQDATVLRAGAQGIETTTLKT